MSTDDDAAEDRRVYFIFMSTRAFDTIEFMQQEWINGGNFADLGGERDPIVGKHDQDETDGQFTIPAEPTRKRINQVTTFNRMSGGRVPVRAVLVSAELDRTSGLVPVTN